jgi:acetoin utilization deacetylase AcuC-like enzyme
MLPVVWSPACASHVPGGEVWIGKPIAGDEIPLRADRILAALTGAGSALVQARAHDDAALLAVHDEGLVAFLREAWATWVAAGYPDDPGSDRVVGYLFQHPGLVTGIEPVVPASPAARTGRWAFDTMTPIGPGTWEAARAAVDCALTACGLVLDGAPAAYACTRPPGHHVTRTAYGGSCYLNNAAIAAHRLRSGGKRRVALLDVDAHHGNGAQSIFWNRADVVTGSVHVDPEAGWFPHFLGLARERGTGDGTGANLNVPLAPGSGDDEWLAGVSQLAAFAREAGADALVVALGVDAATGDPHSPLCVSATGLERAGNLLGQLGLPTVVVQEGGYDHDTIGALVLAALTGLESGMLKAHRRDSTVSRER